MDDFIKRYIEYHKDTESPVSVHRWSVLTSIGALLGRKYFLQFGNSRIFPNLYTMCIGNPGSRKSSAIKSAKRLIFAAGYEAFAADKTSKEKFLLDLEGAVEEDLQSRNSNNRGGKTYNSVLEENLWGDDTALLDPKEVFIVADEFNDFSGVGNLEFFTTLGNLWDWDDDKKPYSYRLKNSKSVSIFQPTVSILGGNTPDNFARAFPPEIIGGGFFSRLLLIHAPETGKKIADPPVPRAADTEELVKIFTKIFTTPLGASEKSSEARELLSDIYHKWRSLEDVRFRSYNSRRHTQLHKLCLICSAARSSSIITAEVVIEANTYLSGAELGMSKALGEFGKNRNSDVANKIVDLLNDARRPLHIKDIWPHVHKDLEKVTQLGEIMNSLVFADKVMYHKDKPSGYLAKNVIKAAAEFVDWNLLTDEERVGL